MIFKNKKKGFALLIATLVAGLFLAIGAVIFQIAYVELLLSSTGRDSQFAFYAADTGAECALYWDKKYVSSTNPGDDSSGSAFNIFNTTTGDTEGSNRQRILDIGPGDVRSPIECSTKDAGGVPAYGPLTLEPAKIPPYTSPPYGETIFHQGDETTGGNFGFTFIKFPVRSFGFVRGCAEVTVAKYVCPTPQTCTLGDGNLETNKTVITSRGYNAIGNSCDSTSDRRVERAIQVTIQ